LKEGDQKDVFHNQQEGTLLFNIGKNSFDLFLNFSVFSIYEMKGMKEKTHRNIIADFNLLDILNLLR